MKILLTGGGTAGHVTPAVAIAEIIKSEYKGSEIAFVGRKNGEENRPILKEGYKLYTIDIEAPLRSLTVKNVKVLGKLLSARREALNIINAFKPDIIIGTGGYVSFPIVSMGIKRKIPVLLHESNAYPGLVTRRQRKGADTVMLGIDEARDYLNGAKNVITVGNPTRMSFEKTNRSRAREKLKISEGELFVVSFGGSGGSDKMNEVIIALMKRAKSGARITHLHASGRKYFDSIKKAYPELTEENKKARVVPYIENMPEVLAAADIAITRSGAMTIAELGASGTPAILIPSPNVAANHQYKNARALKEAGAAIMIEEESLTVDTLNSALSSLVRDGIMRERMKNRLKAISGGECKNNILRVIEDVIKRYEINSAKE